MLAAGAPLMAASSRAPSAIVGGVRPSRGDVARAIVVGSVVFVPAAFLRCSSSSRRSPGSRSSGSSCRCSSSSGRRSGAAFRRAVQLARADYLHALGSLATLVILFGLVKLTLALLLHDLGDAGERAALGLADLVVSPLLFLGAALLYVDQAARVRSSP